MTDHCWQVLKKKLLCPKLDRVQMSGHLRDMHTGQDERLNRLTPGLCL